MVSKVLLGARFESALLWGLLRKFAKLKCSE